MDHFVEIADSKVFDEMVTSFANFVSSIDPQDVKTAVEGLAGMVKQAYDAMAAIASFGTTMTTVLNSLNDLNAWIAENASIKALVTGKAVTEENRKAQEKREADREAGSGPGAQPEHVLTPDEIYKRQQDIKTATDALTPDLPPVPLPSQTPEKKGGLWNWLFGGGSGSDEHGDVPAPDVTPKSLEHEGGGAFVLPGTDQKVPEDQLREQKEMNDWLQKIAESMKQVEGEVGDGGSGGGGGGGGLGGSPAVGGGSGPHSPYSSGGGGGGATGGGAGGTGSGAKMSEYSSAQRAALLDAMQKQEGYFPGSRSHRNNNPGNIEYGDFAKAHGATGSDGRFAIFPDYQTGRNAQENLLFESPGYRNLTLGQAIGKWAPAIENNVPAYLKTMEAALGGGGVGGKAGAMAGVGDYNFMGSERSRQLGMGDVTPGGAAGAHAILDWHREGQGTANYHGQQICRFGHRRVPQGFKRCRRSSH